MAAKQLTVVIEEALAAQAEAAAAQRGETLDEVVRTKLQEYVAETPVDPKHSHAQAAMAAWWADFDQLAAEIGTHWPDTVSAVDAVREVRREL